MSVTDFFQLLLGIPGFRVWLAVSLMAAATATGAVLAKRSSRQAALILVIASGMMLTTAVVDLLPEAWHEGAAVGMPVWLSLATAVTAYLVMAFFTRNGCGCEMEAAAQAAGAHAPGRHRRLKESAGALSVGLGAAAALSTHRVVEGTALALAFSIPVILTLMVASAGDGLALAAMLRETKQRLAPWLLVACASPAVGVLITTVRPLPAAVLPFALALVAGVILRIAVVGLKLAARKRSKGQLSRWHITAAAATTFAMGAFLLAAH
ncbi:hypothetical protein [Streptomyces sp. NPDC002133]|uniref:hypothetical protein n=1 Tax=Streptomyces sp. NPDC002133 TaxID=3154409 RepID=UPI00332F19B5